MPTLIVLRHAKAAAGLGTADFDRPLTDRGRADAAAAGGWLRERGLVPSAVLCSSAARTRETLERLDLGGVPVDFERRVYDNDPDVLLDLVRLTDDAAEVLLLVGHNPSVHQLVHDLAASGAPDAYPTSATAVLAFEDPWAALAPRTGTLAATWTPKG
ncbi:SixA phosphatase family protein [Actinomadura parmotrematis]|uniref:Histidine phosphatase family protein n=1 Tax=Actinomadura parmotrematis TaxID=2864039 RepID=A0ABS7FR94_9ACTN|nr:histidine phosphatase family protein [Actinomadura parmotrematis]MBW8482928.1 histidine phosphatase family protein [Actinomadura parmotrematis]